MKDSSETAEQENSLEQPRQLDEGAVRQQREKTEQDIHKMKERHL